MKPSRFGFLALIFAGCTTPVSSPPDLPTVTPASMEETMRIVSSAFTDNQSIPVTYTCDGDNITPPLEFQDIPPNTKSLALVVDDPDAPAGTWIHWTVWNINPATTAIPASTPPPGSVEGTTSFGSIGYGGTCPPSGTHHYRFTLYALDQMLDLPSGSKYDQLTDVIENHTISTALLTGLYTHN